MVVPHLLSWMQGMDLVIHCAGPFQWKETCAVLDSAIAAGTPYLDVCDDADYSKVRTPIDISAISVVCICGG